MAHPPRLTHSRGASAIPGRIQASPPQGPQGEGAPGWRQTGPCSAQDAHLWREQPPPQCHPYPQSLVPRGGPGQGQAGFACAASTPIPGPELQPRSPGIARVPETPSLLAPSSCVWGHRHLTITPPTPCLSCLHLPVPPPPGRLTQAHTDRVLLTHLKAQVWPDTCLRWPAWFPWGPHLPHAPQSPSRGPDSGHCMWTPPPLELQDILRHHGPPWGNQPCSSLPHVALRTNFSPSFLPCSLCCPRPCTRNHQNGSHAPTNGSPEIKANPSVCGAWKQLKSGRSTGASWSRPCRDNGFARHTGQLRAAQAQEGLSQRFHTARVSHDRVGHAVRETENLTPAAAAAEPVWRWISWQPITSPSASTHWKVLSTEAKVSSPLSAQLLEAQPLYTWLKRPWGGLQPARNLGCPHPTGSHNCTGHFSALGLGWVCRLRRSEAHPHSRARGTTFRVSPSCESSGWASITERQSKCTDTLSAQALGLATSSTLERAEAAPVSPLERLGWEGPHAQLPARSQPCVRDSINALCPTLRAAFQRALLHEHSCVFGWGWGEGAGEKTISWQGLMKGVCGGKRCPADRLTCA